MHIFVLVDTTPYSILERKIPNLFFNPALYKFHFKFYIYFACQLKNTLVVGYIKKLLKEMNK